MRSNLAYLTAHLPELWAAGVVESRCSQQHYYRRLKNEAWRGGVLGDVGKRSSKDLYVHNRPSVFGHAVEGVLHGVIYSSTGFMIASGRNSDCALGCT